MKLPKTAYNWAIRHLMTEGDSDLFPRLPEVEALRYSWRRIIDDLADVDLSNYNWRGGRRFVVPKDYLAFRMATQLDPVDSLMLAALMKRVGGRLERHRVPRQESRVFSYRFEPTDDGRFFGEHSAWHGFWQNSRNKAAQSHSVLIADISDFYNQVDLHVIENQLDAAGLSNEYQNVIKNFMGTYSEKVSRGIPVGPHSVHLLAELALNPIDRALLASGYDFCRYVDDFHIFCQSEEEATSALYELVNLLDSHQKLIVQRQKTQILDACAFTELADTMLVDRPLNGEEEEILDAIARHTGGDPYRQISLHVLSDNELERLSPRVLTDLFELYLAQQPKNYPRIGWLLRRLRQVGAPGGVVYVLQHIRQLSPVLGDAARYVLAAIPNYEDDPHRLGELIVQGLDDSIVEKNSYLQVVLLDVLARLPVLDHADAITARYGRADPQVRREILRVAASNGIGAWLRGKKASFRTLDPWSRRAYILGLSTFPGEEAEMWLRGVRNSMSPLEKRMAQFSFKRENLRLGKIGAP